MRTKLEAGAGLVEAFASFEDADRPARAACGERSRKAANACPGDEKGVIGGAGQTGLPLAW
jgi:hypothetical protein